MKRSLSVLLSAVMLIASLAVVAIPASAEVAGDWQYTVSGGEATVTGYTGTAITLTVPDTLGGVPVTAIGVNAFENNTALTAVTLPDDVQLIDECAFAGCSALASIHLGKVSTIGFSAFYGCDALTAVSFGGTETQWKAVAIAKLNDPLTAATVTCASGSGTVSLLPADRSEFLTISEGGGVIDVFKVTEGYRFSSWTGWPSAYTRRTEDEYVTVDVFSDTYLNFDFTVHTGQTNIILAFEGMDIINLRTVGHYVTINRLVDPGYVDENGIIYDMGAGTYTASVHVGALGCDPSLVKNGTFRISDIKIYAVNGASVTVRDLSVGEAKYDIWDLPQTSYTIKDKQTLLPDAAKDFRTAHTDTGNISISKKTDGYQLASSAGWPCGYTTRFETGEGYVLADPDDYIYYDFTVYDYSAIHLAVYFAGTSPLTTVAGTYASLNPRIHPNYIDANGNIIDLPYGNYKGFIKVRDLGYSSSLLQNGKLPVSDIKIYAVNGTMLVRELAVVSIETYTTETTTSSTTETTTTTTSSTTETTTTTTTTTTTLPTVTFSVSSHAAQIGDVVTVSVNVSDDHHLTNGQLWIDYDPTVLKATDVWGDPDTPYVYEVNRDIFGDNCFWAFDIVTPGRAKFAFASGAAQGSATGGTMFEISFKVIAYPADGTVISLSSPEMGATKDGVDYGAAASFTSGTVKGAPFLLGDIDLDGDVTIHDATMLFHHINGTVTLTAREQLAADVAPDGILNLLDAVRLFYMVNGLI